MLVADGLRKRFGAFTATAGVSLRVAAPGLHALIGPNGAGKTTLVNLLTGTVRPDAGRIVLDGADVTAVPPHRRARLGLVRTFQVTQLPVGFTAGQVVALAVQSGCAGRLRAWGRADADARWNAAARDALAEVGLADRAAVPVEEMSHGERRGVELAAALALQPRCLLLDEPLAGMGAAEAEAVIALLERLKARLGLLLVEHDTEAVFRLADVVTVLVDGAVAASGPPAVVRADPAVRAAYLGQDDLAQAASC